jgi:hypothetical protein
MLMTVKGQKKKKKKKKKKKTDFKLQHFKLHFKQIQK